MLAAAACLGAAVSVLLLAARAAALQGPVFPIAAFLIGAIAAGFWAREYQKLKTARLIVENQILCIRPAVISGEGEAAHHKSIDVYISYFGILLSTDIVKFNQDSIRLTAVEIGRDFISLTYGAGGRVRTTRLLRAAIPREELADIVERFRFETGVTPEIVL